MSLLVWPPRAMIVEVLHVTDIYNYSESAKHRQLSGAAEGS
jgi:predicted amino acid racemase